MEEPRKGVVGNTLSQVLAIVASLWSWKFVLLILFGLSIALIAVRASFIALLPWMAEHYRAVTIALDAIINTLNVLEFTVEGLVDAIKIGISLITNGKHPKHISVDFKVIPYVSATKVHDTLIDIARTCTGHQNGFHITRFITRESFNKWVCPAVRSLQPTVLATPALKSTTWLTYDVDPDQGEQSCKPYRDDIHTEWICVGLGSGWVMLEVILPLIIGWIIVYHLALLGSAIYHKR